ncbi:MAG TPA: type II toxin-antitoxin system ParD family antitoxin [Gammaproteobacteria bacterium]|nr:type II toxin-antitoxin system ParD family antitoxin [Gammaproteobacteria bacterium]
MPRNTSVILGEYFDQFVTEQLKQGRYQSVSEVIRAGLRRLEDDEIKRQQLRARLEAAEKSPTLAPLDADDFLAALHHKQR